MKAYYYVFVSVSILFSSCVLEGGVPGPAGGYVFYDKGAYSDGWRYLECAPEDLGGAVSWEKAKSACEDYWLGGYNDWRLPTITELELMYNNLHEKGIGNFKNDYSVSDYWSSKKEEGDYYYGGYDYYYYFSFSTGSSSYSSSFYSYNARPMRQF